MRFAQSRATWWMIAAVLFSAAWACGCNTDQADRDTDRDASNGVVAPDFSEEVEAVLDRRIRLVEGLAAQPVLVAAVRAANQEHQDMQEGEVLDLDRRWQAGEGSDELAEPILTSECARTLKDFQEEHDGFSEIFVTDAKGLVVAATNRTSDYWQADEAWWERAYNQGRGKSYYGAIDYDDSAFSESISLYVPIIDSDSAKAIGVLKAVCDITAIKMEL